METLISLLGGEAAAVGTIVYAMFSLAMVPPTWRVFRRAGMGGAWALLFPVPGFGPLLVLALLAFAPWRPWRPERG